MEVVYKCGKKVDNKDCEGDLVLVRITNVSNAMYTLYETRMYKCARCEKTVEC